jgi:serine phosphatase RsbU (regulator of sigma subunit)
LLPNLPCRSPVAIKPPSRQLDAGDVVITYTDGVIEAANQSGEEWGVQGLLKATHAWARLRTGNAEHFVRSTFNSLYDFLGRAPDG